MVIDYRVVVLRGIQCDTESSCLDDSVVYGLAIIKRDDVRKILMEIGCADAQCFK